ncbi:MAG TPA: PH domain-containing protein [Blastocatellia bacterium]|nr:PH domain-containing protein [Blastocatellia bacterium]
MLYEPPRETEAEAIGPETVGAETVGAKEGLAKASLLEGRLHPMTLLLGVYNYVRRMILPLIPLIVLERGVTTVVIITLMLAAGLARALVRYFTFSYSIERGELITREGLFERTERHIPLERIQEIRIEQGILHRLFGVVDAAIETAGGQRPEARLSVLSLREAERLRQAVFEKESARRVAVAGSAQDDKSVERERVERASGDREVIIRLRLRDLILAGLTSNHVLSALVLVGTLMAFVDDILPESFYRQLVDSVSAQIGRVAERGVMAAAVAAVLAMIIFFLASLLLSITGSVALFYNFTLARAGEDLHRSYGLLTKRTSSLPRRRIQMLEIKEGVLRRLFKLAALRADTAGSDFSESGERRQGQGVLLPIAPRDELDRLLGTIFPDLEAAPREWARTSRLAVARAVISSAIICMALSAALSWYAESLLGLWSLALVPVVYIVSLMRYRALGYTTSERYFYMRRGWPGRSTYILPIRNVQAVAVRQTPVDHKLGLATLSIDSAGQSRLGGPQLPNLPVDEAYRLARSIAHRAASTQYRW